MRRTIDAGVVRLDHDFADLSILNNDGITLVAKGTKDALGFREGQVKSFGKGTITVSEEADLRRC